VHRTTDAALSVLDRWIRSRQETTTRDVVGALDAYDIVSATASLEAFADDLSNWYVRLSRRRYWRGGMGDDKAAAYGTLREALLTLARLVAPFVPFLAEAVYQPLRAADAPESVHLCAYPVTNDAAVDSALEVEMRLARSIAALGHQARNQAQIRVRQPLAHVVVASSSGASLRDEVRELIERELNVRRVDVVTGLGAYLTETAAPNFRSIGPRLGAAGPQVAAWIKKQGAAALRATLATGPATVALGKETVEIRPEDVTYTAALPEGYVQAEDGADRLLLDVRMDEELRRQGLFREVVHRIQVARKDAGFDVTDRIRLAYEADPALSSILAEHEEEIAAEVLAVSVKRDVKGRHEYTQTIELDEGRRVGIGLTRVRGG
jgi:isoleucyl-tRNA synthetase